MIISKNAKYLQAILSSRLYEYAYKRIFSSIELGEAAYQYNKHALVKLPVKQLSNQEEKIIEVLVDKIIEKNAKNVIPDTSFLESKIDDYVYNLYDITDEERSYIKQEV